MGLSKEYCRHLINFILAFNCSNYIPNEAERLLYVINQDQIRKLDITISEEGLRCLSTSVSQKVF